MRVTLRPTQADDIPHCIGEPLPYRIRAITALVDDRVIGLGGIGFRPDGYVIAFAAILPEARKYPAAIHRAGRMAVDMMRRSGIPMVVAEAQPGNPAAARWLLRLGFKREHNGFVWRA